MFNISTFCFRLVIDRETGKPKGYGFCEYKDEETALSARRNLQGYEINGRQLRVDFAENDKGSDRNREQVNFIFSLPSFPFFIGTDNHLVAPLQLPFLILITFNYVFGSNQPNWFAMLFLQNGSKKYFIFMTNLFVPVLSMIYIMLLLLVNGIRWLNYILGKYELFEVASLLRYREADTGPEAYFIRQI